MKKILTAMVCAVMALTMLFCGCTEPSDGRDGRDGKDGQNVSIYDVYEAAKSIEGNENLTFEEFLKEYLSYNNSSTDLKATINRSLMSGVSILSRFAYTSKHQSSIPGLNSSRTSYKVFSGSGVILWLDKNAGDAYVATNCHVVYDDTADSAFCTDVRLYLYGQDESGFNYAVDTSYNIKGDENYRIEAEVIGASISYDIALLKVTDSEVLRRSDAVAASFSDNPDVYAGEYVYAIGNASGEGMSASNGIISKDSEYIELSLSEKEYLTDEDYYQYRVMRTTAAINHGNSGGALYNTYGEIVAIVNAKDESSDIDNMGYALPANSVKPLLQLMYDNYVSNGKTFAGGGIEKAFLNIETTATDSYSWYNHSTGLAEITEQIIISNVVGAPARNNLLADDFLKEVKIVEADGNLKLSRNVTRRYHVSEAMLYVRKGDTVVLTVERNGENVEVSIPFDKDGYFKNFA